MSSPNKILLFDYKDYRMPQLGYEIMSHFGGRETGGTWRVGHRLRHVDGVEISMIHVQRLDREMTVDEQLIVEGLFAAHIPDPDWVKPPNNSERNN